MMQAYERLEAEWAEFNQLDPAGMVACASGTAALHLACEAMRENNSGKTVLCPDFTMVACPRAIVTAGLTPVFIDCGDGLNIDPQLVEDWISDPANNAHGNLFGVMAVHVYGRRCDVDRIRRAAFDVGSCVIEDLAEAHGVKPHPGTDAACWSFFRNKQAAGEEGGAVWFRDKKHAELAKNLRCLGFTAAHDYMHIPRGWNHRLSNAHAELVLRSLHVFQENDDRRREIECWYDAACPPEWRMPARDAVWVYDFRVPGMSKARQDVLVRELRSEGIEARHFFQPMSRQPEFLSCRTVGTGKAAEAAREGVYLPCTPGLVTEASCRRAFEIATAIVG